MENCIFLKRWTNIIEREGIKRDKNIFIVNESPWIFIFYFLNAVMEQSQYNNLQKRKSFVKIPNQVLYKENLLLW